MKFFSPVDSPVICISCGSLTFKSMGLAKIIDPKLDDTFEILNCSNCAHWITYPVPSQELLNNLYSKDSTSVLGEESSKNYLVGHQNSTLSDESHWVVKRLKSERAGYFLEIGPGDGSLLRKMRSLGWDSYGVDPGQYFEDPKVLRNVSEFSKDLTFKVIVLQDILEHTSDPWAELKQYVPYLSIGARIFITFPWSESNEAIKLGAKWEMVKPIGHLHYFSRKSALSLLKSVGAELIKIEVINVNGSKAMILQKLLRHTLTFPLQFLRSGKIKHPIRSRLNLLRQHLASVNSVGDQLYVEGKVSLIPQPNVDLK